MRGLDGVGRGQVVVLAGVDDDPRAGVDLAAEALVDEGAHRVDVAEEDPVHRVVEHHVEPLEPGQRRDLRHAQAAGVVGQPHVAAQLAARVVERGAHQPEVLLGRVGAGEALAGGALRHVVEQRLAGGADHRDHVGALACGLLGLRDVLVDVAGRDDQVDPRLPGGVADLARRAARARGDGRRSVVRRPRPACATRCVLAGRRGPRGRRNRTEPAEAFWARVTRSSASPRSRASQTGRARPCSSPTSARAASASRLTHGVPSGSAPDRPARRSVARSTETVVCCWASFTIGRPTLRARLRARRTVAGSRSSFFVHAHSPSLRSNSPGRQGSVRTRSSARSAWPGV